MIFMASLVFASAVGMNQVFADSAVVPQKVADHTGTNGGNYILPTLAEKVGSGQGILYPYSDENTVTNWDESSVESVVFGNGTGRANVIPRIGSTAIISNAMRNDTGEIFDLRVTFTDMKVQYPDDYGFSIINKQATDPEYSNWYFALYGVTYYEMNYEVLVHGTENLAPAQNILMVSSDLDSVEFLVADTKDGFVDVLGSETALYKTSNGKFIAGNGGTRRGTNSAEPWLTQQPNYEPNGFAGWYTENSSSFNLGYMCIGGTKVPAYNDNNPNTTNDREWHYFDSNADGTYDLDLLFRDGSYTRLNYAQAFLPGVEKMGSVLVHYVEVESEGQDYKTGTKLADDFWNAGIIGTEVYWPEDKKFDGLNLIKNTQSSVVEFKENQQEVWLVYIKPENIGTDPAPEIPEGNLEVPNTGYKKL